MAIDFSFPAWLRDQHSFADSLAKGAQVGAIIANNRYRNQALAAQAIQAEREYELREKQLNAQIKTQDLNYRLQSQAIDDQLADKTAISEWVLKRNALPLKDRIGMQMPNLRLSQSYGIVNQIADNDQKTFDSTQRNFAPGDLEKDLNFYRKLQADPDTPPEILSLAKATLESKAQKPGFSARFGPGGTLEEVIYGKPGAVPGTPTTAVQTDLQKDINNTRHSLNLMGNLQKNIRSQDVGFYGVIGESVIDRLFPQFGITSPDLKRTDNRTKLRTLVQGMMRQISPDNRFTNEDRKRIEDIMPDLGVLENVTRAKQVLSELSKVFAERNVRDMQALGAPLEMPKMSDEEIAAAARMGLIDRNEAKQFLMENR